MFGDTTFQQREAVGLLSRTTGQACHQLSKGSASAEIKAPLELQLEEWRCLQKAIQKFRHGPSAPSVWSVLCAVENGGIQQQHGLGSAL